MAFENCTALKKITVADGANALTVSRTSFLGCSIDTVYMGRSMKGNGYADPLFGTGVKHLTISDSVTFIGDGAFSGCSGLATLTIPSSVVNIEGTAFDNCAGLKKLTLPDCPNTLTVASNSFAGCFVDTVYMGRNVTCQYSNPLFAGVNHLTIGDSVTFIKTGAFQGCSTLVAVSIPNSVTSIGSGAFMGCSTLTSIDIPTSVTTINNSTFKGCSSMTSLTIPNGITTIGSEAFMDCVGLKKLTVVDGNSALVLGRDAFTNCPIDTLYMGRNLNSSLSSTGVKHLTIGDSVTSIVNYAFANCRGLTSVTIPNGITTIGNAAFGGCTALKNLTITDGASTLALNGVGINYVFYGSDSIETVYMGRNVSNGNNRALFGTGVKSLTIGDSVSNVGNYAFQNCKAITSVTFHNGIASIGDFAFQNNSGLTRVAIGNNVANIGSSAFSGCTALRELNCSSTTPPLAQPNTFTNVDKDLCALFVPLSSLNLYKTANVWKEFYELNDDATLKSLTVSEGSLSPNFSANITKYTIYVPNNVASITLSAVTNDSKASISGVGAKALEVGVNTFSIVVTAENEAAVKIYTITVTRYELNSDATLKSLTVSEGSLSPSYSTNTTKYTVNVPNNTTSITLLATANDNAASVSGVGIKTLKVGTNNFSIVVTAENKTTTKTYVVTVIRAGQQQPPTATTVGTNAQSAVKLYPNPTTNGQLIVDNEQWAAGEAVEIYNLSGALVAKVSTTGAQATLNVSALPSGTYVVKVGKYAGKFVKQ
jgi:hypothetical protein